MVEVKHYKRRSRKNFRSALVDYASAHPEAHVVLVNYGQVGERFGDLPSSVRDRREMIGDLTPENSSALAHLRELVRAAVGDPVPAQPVYMADAGAGAILAVDVFGSMRAILGSGTFRDFVEPHQEEKIVLIDNSVRTTVTGREIHRWLAENKLGAATSLIGPIEQLLAQRAAVVLLTDRDGMGGRDNRALVTTPQQDQPDGAVHVVARRA